MLPESRWPSGDAIAVTYDATISTSTQVTFNTATKQIAVTALGQAVLMNWGTTAASTTVFDEVIPPATTKYFFVPSTITAANFIEEAVGGKLVVVEK